ncbi:peptidoglycan-binding protein [Crocinitomicaceae bacterium CZZ-1]|uniref:Peptidoglycan-binding protein n=1 Tax=Taishania pollutisoli TaxID=2766479 RepID=A0A8J6PDM6_9FLAO|nr:hypothetical protein [Taishania pollutisoli]MBC9811510.1 peptidoglycan-binding protein [Taishania pollutisoli]
MIKTVQPLFLLILTTFYSFGQLKKVPIGQRSSENNALTLELTHRNQYYKSVTASDKDVYEPAINSPKSVTFSQDGSKYYIQSLEGCETVVFDAKTHKKIKGIAHKFNAGNKQLFKNNEYTLFDYVFPEDRSNPNFFSGKPVEACLSANGDWLFVTYYRRSYDANAQLPSALCVIDTEKDEIVRVIPTAPLPKMIAASSDGKYVAVTHWGDNTVGVLDVSSNDPFQFNYVKLLEVDKRVTLVYDTTEIIDRDNNCSNCLRGTTFTPDSKYLLIGRMGGNGGLAIFRMSNFSKVGSVAGLKPNIRHILVDTEYIYMSVNKTGYVDKVKWGDVRYHFNPEEIKTITVKPDKSVFVGTGARTIAMDPKSEYTFAAVNNESKIVVIRNSDWKVVTEINADSYPVGLAVSPDGKQLIATAQGKGNQGGNSVMVYSIQKQ